MKFTTLLPALTMVGLLGLTVPAGVCAQETAAAPPAAKKEAAAKMDSATAGGFTAADKKLIKAAAQSDETEISMAKLALSKTENADVKKYAQMMVADHGKTTAQLKPIADAAGVPKPDLKPKDKATAAKLEGLSGNKFDVAYLEANVQAHQATAAKMKALAPAATNPDLKSFAAATLPVVEHHTTMAQELLTKVSAAGGAKKASL